MEEFELIWRFFDRPAQGTATVLSVGDDCALLRPDAGYDVAVTVDTMVEGVHFFEGTNAERLGHKALAVNLSDLAAMGAIPRWVTLALTLPSVDESWLASFSKGFFELARWHRVDLIGGDTTRGPLSITVQAMGQVKRGKALRRSDAKVGDGIYLSGQLGLAGLGLKLLSNQTQVFDPEAIQKLEKPEPRVDLGMRLLNIANACIDVSDGLAADLNHILTASKVGATLEWRCLPLSNSVLAYIDESGDWSMPLVSGDDYELCFTVPAKHEAELEALGCIRIGSIEADPGLRLVKGSQLIELSPGGFNHFI